MVSESLQLLELLCGNVSREAVAAWAREEPDGSEELRALDRLDDKGNWFIRESDVVRYLRFDLDGESLALPGQRHLLCVDLSLEQLAERCGVPMPTRFHVHGMGWYEGVLIDVDGLRVYLEEVLGRGETLGFVSHEDSLVAETTARIQDFMLRHAVPEKLVHFVAT